MRLEKLRKTIDGREVCGLNLYILDNDDEAHDCRPFGLIEHVWTHEDYRNRGYASELLQKAINMAEAAHCYKLIVETSSKKPHVRHLYLKMGFKENLKTAYYLGFE